MNVVDFFVSRNEKNKQSKLFNIILIAKKKEDELWKRNL